MSRKMTGRTQTLPLWLGAGGIKTTENIVPVGPDHVVKEYINIGGKILDSYTGVLQIQPEFRTFNQ
jgi:hypothetical protein